MSASPELEQFRDFLNEFLSKSESSALLPEDVLELWRRKYPMPEELAASAADLQKAVAEMESGAEGTPAREVSDELRGRLN